MAAKTGTVVVAGKRGEVGQQYTARGKIALDAALATTNTYTISNLLPKGGAKVIAFRFYGVEVDTNATPTCTVSIGNSDDPDGFLKTKGGAVGLQNSLAGQLTYFGDGDLIGTTVTNRDLTMTVVANPATGATSGDLFYELVLEGV